MFVWCQIFQHCIQYRNIIPCHFSTIIFTIFFSSKGGGEGELIDRQSEKETNKIYFSQLSKALSPISYQTEWLRLMAKLFINFRITKGEMLTCLLAPKIIVWNLMAKSSYSTLNAKIQFIIHRKMHYLCNTRPYNIAPASLPFLFPSCLLWKMFFFL